MILYNCCKICDLQLLLNTPLAAFYGSPSFNNICCETMRKYVGQKATATCNWILFLSQELYLDANHLQYLFYLVVEHDRDANFH